MLLRDELLAMAAEDLATRARLAEDGSLFDGYHPEMEAVHRKNAERLRAIVEASGWPARAQVGEDAAEAAWLVVQHAIGEPAFMRAMLPLIAAGDADPAQVAMLEDRIRVSEGRPQRYGTQYDWDDTGTQMVPMIGVEEPATVEARRRAVGLGPMEWSRPAPPGERPPRDLAAHRAAMIEWARRVGWR